MNGFWSSFKLDRWYKLVAGLSGLALMASVLVHTQIPNKTVFVLALGGLCIGMGEWINNRPVIHHQRVPGGIISTSGTERHVHLGGVVLDAAGAILLGLGLFKILA